MKTLKRSKVIDKVRKELFNKSDNGVVCLHTKDIHHLFELGPGSCSIDRYIRFLRQMGEIEYEDPRRNKYMYIIKLNKGFYENCKEEIWK